MNLDHVFIELGLSDDNIAVASVTGMAAVRTDRKGKVLAAYSDSVSHSTRPNTKDGIDRLYEGLSDALIKPYPAQYVVIAQHANAYKQAVGENCFRGKAWLDIAQLAWPLGYCDMISNRDLDTLCKHFSIAIDSEGTMSGNCEALVRVYWAMINRYRVALIGEEAIRDIGGESLAKVRKFFSL
jgi:hypothetical protein